MVLSEIAARSIGIPESSARFLIALFSAHIFAVVYRSVIVDQQPKVKSLYCTISGVCIIIYVYGSLSASLVRSYPRPPMFFNAHKFQGFLIWHSVLDILVIYLVLYLCGGTLLSVIITMLFTMGHLLIGYAHIVMSERVHSIAWTIPHCVLVLKLIGLSFNLYDARKKPEELTDIMKKNAVTSLPSFLDVVAFSYFYGSVLAGPQITFARHISFIEGTLFNWYKTPSSVSAGIQRLLCGVPIAVLYITLNRLYPATLITTDIYLEQSFFTKIWWAFVCTKVMMWRYMIVWLVAESACIITGISYDGTDSSGKVNWAGLTNIHIIKHEQAIRFQEIAESFNVNTNQWLMWYVYSRLKWLGNKALSLALTMLFLSLWHGLWPGYYISFLYEMMYIMIERTSADVLRKLTGYQSLSEVPITLRAPFITVLFINRSILFPYPLALFMLLRWSDCYRFMKGVYFYGHIVVAAWFLFYFLVLLPYLRSSKRKQH